MQDMLPDNKKRTQDPQGACRHVNTYYQFFDSHERAIKEEQINISNQRFLKRQNPKDTFEDSLKTISKKMQKKTQFQNLNQNFNSPCQNENGIGMDESQDMKKIGIKHNIGLKDSIMKDTYINHSLKTIHQNQQRQQTQETYTNMQSPQSHQEESKENISDCNSASTKPNRSFRDTNCSSKTTSMITSPSQILNKRQQDNDIYNENEPNICKKIKSNFMEDLFIQGNTSQNTHLNCKQNKESIKSQIKYNQSHQYNRDSIQQPKTQYSQQKISVHKINFDNISNSIDKTHQQAALTFQQKNSYAPSKIIEEIDGQSKTIKNGNLLIQISKTDDYNPRFYNQQYQEENIDLIQTKQYNVNQSKRLLKLDTINSIQIDKDNCLINLLDFNVIKDKHGNQIHNGIVEYEQTIRPQSVTKQKVKCKCKKSKCLLLYCECFSQGDTCSDECSCSGCSNNNENREERENAMNQLKVRNPDAFKPKIQTKEDDQETLVHNKGCNCKKSKCKKKYCECYNQGVMCSDQCKCDDCENQSNNPQQLTKLQSPRPDKSTFIYNNQTNKFLKNGGQHLNENIFQRNNSLIYNRNNFIKNQHLIRQSQQQNMIQNPSRYCMMSIYNQQFPHYLLKDKMRIQYLQQMYIQEGVFDENSNQSNTYE